MKQRSELGALLAECLWLAFVLQFKAAYLFWESLRLYRYMHRYFKSFSIKRLASCYRTADPACFACLKKIYDHEQEVLSVSRRLQNRPWTGWFFRRLAYEIEDRAETLILATDQNAQIAINKAIAQIESLPDSSANWRQRLHAL